MSAQLPTLLRRTDRLHGTHDDEATGARVMDRCTLFEGCRGTGELTDLTDSGSGRTWYCRCLAGQQLKKEDDLLRERDALRAEVERLKAEGVQVNEWGCEAALQRDALADALAHFYECGYDRGKAEAVLRLAGRLPQVPDGPR